jgi:hypothetical protein
MEGAPQPAAMFFPARTRLELPMGRQVVIGHDELNIGK